MEVRPEERLLPLFWAVDGFKQRQEDFPNPPLTELKGPLPASEKAAAELADAIERADLDAAERARGRARPEPGRPADHGTALALRLPQWGTWAATRRSWFRAASGRWKRSAGNMPSPSSALSCGTCIPWVDAESRIRIFCRTRPAWIGISTSCPRAGPQATATGRQPSNCSGCLRAGKADQACELAIEQLHGGAGAQAVWDAVHLATAELMVRHSSGWGVASRPLHSNTSAGALHYAFRTSDSARTRLLVLLQAVAWTGDKTNSELRDESLRDIAITELPLPRVALPAAAERGRGGDLLACSLPGTITGTPRPKGRDDLWQPGGRR